MEIANAYVHEKAMLDKPVYVKEPLNSEARYKNRRTSGLLIRILCGGKYAG